MGNTGIEENIDMRTVCGSLKRVFRRGKTWVGDSKSRLVGAQLFMISISSDSWQSNVVLAELLSVEWDRPIKL